MNWGSFFIGWMFGAGLVWYLGHRVIQKAWDKIPEEHWPEDLFG